jgi:hypothetical protein
VIVDTGPIWELVLYRAVKELSFASLGRDLKHFVSSEAYENCGSFLSSFKKRTTSAAVVAELYLKIRGTQQNGHPQLWNLVYEEFRSMSMDEDVVKLLDMQADLVAKYGPTDVSLIEIARQNLDQKPVILTLDGRLRDACLKAQIRSDLLVEVCNPGG